MTAADNPSFELIRWAVFILNFILWITGMGVLGVSLWLMFDNQFARDLGIGEESGFNYYTAVYILLVVGLLLFLFGFLGCFGALRKSQVLLSLFFILLLVVFVIQLVCAILMYYYQDNVKNYVEKSMLDAIKYRYGKSPYTQAIDDLQETFQCCGARSYTNWLQSTYFQTENPPDPEFASVGSLASGVGSVPSSCCTAKGKRAYKDCGLNFASTDAALHTFVDAKNPEESLIHAKACNDALFDYFNDRSNLIIAIAVGVGCIELVAMVLTMLLCCCINNDKNASKNRYY